MPESTVARYLLDASILVIILASILEVYLDVSGREVPSFLPAPLSNLRSSEPATALAGSGLLLFVAGFALEMVVSGYIPGGRVIVGLLAAISFLFAGGFLVSEGEEDAGRSPEVDADTEQ